MRCRLLAAKDSEDDEADDNPGTCDDPLDRVEGSRAERNNHEADDDEASDDSAGDDGFAAIDLVRPRKGPMSVSTAMTVLAFLGAPETESSSAHEDGIISFLPMASMRRVEAPKNEFMGPRGPSVPMMSIAM